ncbi:MAG TPA: hypothetical protein VH370_27600 [Humisphaera sp.]|jgi:hypothetical protein|nr:hypothetical protein [Humisphaera sp.]
MTQRHANHPLAPIHRYALPGGAIALLACAAIGFFGKSHAIFFNAWLFAWLFWFGISMGCMGLTMMHQLTGGDWGTLIRPITSAAARALPLLFILFIPILFGLRDLFPWANPDLLQHDPILAHQHSYLNPTQFLIRFILYFAVWIVMSWPVTAPSLGHGRTRRALSAPGLVLYVLLMTLAAVDWIMSRQAHWTSTVFGFITVVSQTLTALCFIIVIVWTRSSIPQIAAFARPSHFNDLGNLLLTLVILWAYMNFSQYLITWTGNEQRDVGWYVQRTYGGWRAIGGIIIFIHFLTPLILLMFRDIKQRINRLGILAAALLALRILDLYWNVGPLREDDPHSGFTLSLMDVLAWIGIGGIWFWVFTRALARRPALEPVDNADEESHEPQVA